jgi:hypothetical protein
MKFIYAYLRNLKKKLEKATENLLFVFDNCDDFKHNEDYFDMILSMKKPKIIVTTRKSIPIEDFKSDETKEIFLDPFNEKGPEIVEAKKLKPLIIKNVNKYNIKIIDTFDEISKVNKKDIDHIWYDHYTAEGNSYVCDIIDKKIRNIKFKSIQFNRCYTRIEKYF